jgi:DNA-binding MarR family transcriptional regulator
MQPDVERDQSNREETTDALRFQGNTGYLLAMAGGLCRQRWVAMLGQFDINPSQYKVLMCLGELGSLGQRHLAELIGIDPRNCVPIIESLAQRGLLSRESDASDRRRRVLGLTDGGKRLARDLTVIGDRIALDVLHPLKPAEQALLRRMLVTVLDYARD